MYDCVICSGNEPFASTLFFTSPSTEDAFMCEGTSSTSGPSSAEIYSLLDDEQLCVKGD